MKIRDVISMINKASRKQISDPPEDLVKAVRDFRISEEKYYDWEEDKKCFLGTCQDASKNLEKHLQSKGYKAERYGGYYRNISDDFIPDTEERVKRPIRSWMHWWVIVDDKWIADTTADQFHPGEEDEYRCTVVPKNHPDYRKR